MADLAQRVVGCALDHSHATAWKHYGLFGKPPRPRGLLIGEAPGPNTNALLPLFPHPSNSTGARLLKYANVDPADWLGKLVRMNLCDGTWSTRRAVAGRARALAYLFDESNYYDGAPLRVLLLGERVARAWSCFGRFGYVACTYHFATKVAPSKPTVDLHVAWIPHPSGKNLLYNSRRNQLRARRAVLWALGEREAP
jgi:hypothetical protein